MSRMAINVGVSDLKRGTNVLDIDVPPKLRERKLTGIEWFDNALGGQGMVPSTVGMLTGTPGAGKTTLWQQLADSCSGQGHIALLNSGEESPFQMKMVAERLKLKNGYIIDNKIRIQDLLDHANDLIKKNPKKQVIIFQDSLQTLDDGKYADGTTNSKTPLRCVEMLTEWAKETFGIVWFIGQVTKSGEFQGKNGILHCVDARAKLYVDMDKRSETWGERLFEIPKNRFGVTGKTHIVGLNETGLYEKGYISPSLD